MQGFNAYVISIVDLASCTLVCTDYAYMHGHHWEVISVGMHVIQLYMVYVYYLWFNVAVIYILIT